MEENKLIAEFMGLVRSSVVNKYWTEKNSEGIGIGELVGLQFHTDWNWLMKVVEKIENYNNGHTLVIIEDERCHIDTQNGYNVDTVCDKKISAVYDACCGFIEWYNNNQLNK